MSAFGFVLIGLAAFVVFVMIARLFNHLVLVKNNVHRAWSDVSVLLKQRQDELRNLVLVCREHADFERSVLERVTRARGQVDHALQLEDPARLGNVERALRVDLDQLFLLAEGYPTLKADESFRYLSQRLSEMETAIADRREFYNSTVEIHNTTIQSFPEMLLAGPFGFRAAEFLVFDRKPG
jgi:LemA protein